MLLQWKGRQLPYQLKLFSATSLVSMHFRSEFTVAWSALFAVLLCSLLSKSQTISESQHFRTFADYSGGKFRHLAVGPKSGQVYVDGMNRIYQLNLSLELVSNFTNGPVDDAPECSVSECPPQTVLQPTSTTLPID